MSDGRREGGVEPPEPLFAHIVPPPPSDGIGLDEGDLATEVDVRATLGARARRDLGPGPRDVAGAVVVTFHDEGHIAARLRRLMREVASVIVIDLSGNDIMHDLAAKEFPGLEVVSLPTAVGFYGAVNEGIRHLDQPFILALHGDSQLRPQAIEELFSHVAAERRQIAAAGARLVSTDGLAELSCGFRPTAARATKALLHQAVLRFRTGWLARAPKRLAWFAPLVLTDVDWVSGAAMMLRRDAWEAVGGMDERYFLAWGDVDFCLRLRRAGWSVVYDPRARVIHMDRVEEASESRRAARRRFRRAHGPLRLLRRGRA
jgi:N-acetylglucosaminyl-diphospho-decaprenol L-rhamnosyltransferase